MVMKGTDMKVAEAPTAALESLNVNDAYTEWQAREGVRVITDFAFEDLGTVELSPWERKGGSGAIINIPNDRLSTDSHLVEIKAGGKSEPEHHLYEATVYIVSGRGATTIWVDEGHEQTFEWHAGSLFAIPLNAWYQHFNGSGTEPARYLAVTNAPPVMRLFNDLDFVFNSPHAFRGRFDGQDDYFSGGKRYENRVWRTNFIPNAPDLPLFPRKERGAGGIIAMLEMAGENLKPHMSEFPVGTYKKAHRHGPGAHLLILSGEGFSLLWTKDDMSDMRKADWKAGGMVIVPHEACFHQHFNTGTTRARYLALKGGDMGLNTPHAGSGQFGARSMDEGGWQVEYDAEDRRVHDIFETALAAQSATCRMKAFVPWCTGEVGPTDERDT